MYIAENETLEDLQLENLKIIQKKDSFRFGIDAVLLSDFAKNILCENALDLCSGSGIIPILLSKKSKIPNLYAIEIQKDMVDTAERSIALNKLENRINLTCGDLKNAAKIYNKRSFGLITCNPPYMPKGTAVTNAPDSKTIARHEILCTLEDIISVSSKLLAVHGHFMMVHRPSRLTDIISLMRKYEIEPKRLRFIHKNISEVPSLLLIDGTYKGGRELNIMPPLILYENEKESEELRRIYGK